MSRLKSKIESLLFISAKPMSVKQLAGLLKAKEPEVKKAGEELVKQYQEDKKGVQIIKNASKFQMVSSPENAKLIQDFLSDETSGELSRPSLETLTIIAYRGPISKLDLDRIRGVNCSLILRNLLLRGLVEVKIDKDSDESWYNVSMDFIRFLGIRDIKELPDFDRLSQDDTVDRVLEEHESEKNKAEKKEAGPDKSSSDEDGGKNNSDQDTETDKKTDINTAEKSEDTEIQPEEEKTTDGESVDDTERVDLER